jgi:hypothetical protein
MPPAGFELAILATKRTQTYALDRAANEIGHSWNILKYKQLSCIITSHCYSSSVESSYETSERCVKLSNQHTNKREAVHKSLLHQPKRSRLAQSV